MSDIQLRAGQRWLFLCRLKGNRATFADARELIPIHCNLSGEHGENNSRGEPEWLQAMRNFQRDVLQGKYRRHYIAVPDGLQWTPKGEQELSMVSEQQVNQLIRRNGK
jgi:hypothetical protein